jgi:hypothetical protein
MIGLPRDISPGVRNIVSRLSPIKHKHVTSVPEVNWAHDWQKDGRFSKTNTIDLIKQAGYDYEIRSAFEKGILIVNAGPHRGVDGRMQIVVSIHDGPCWHIILNDGATTIVTIDKRLRATSSF